MPRHPTHFECSGLPHPAPVEAAARRHMRGVQSSYPAILEWKLRVHGLEAAAGDCEYFAARVEACIPGGDRVRAEARGADAFAAVRLAFHLLEQQLQAEHERARHRAAQWLELVRRNRSGQGSVA